LVCDDYCKKNNYNLIYFIKDSQLEFAEKLNTGARLIPVDSDYCNFLAGPNYIKYSQMEYSTKLKILIKTKYINDLNISNCNFYTDLLSLKKNCIPIKQWNLLRKINTNEFFNIPNKTISIEKHPNIIFNKYEKNILSFNLRNVNDCNHQQPVYELWDYIIKNKIKKYPKHSLFFVSGDAKMLKHFNSKYNGINNIEIIHEYETKYAASLGQFITRGASLNIFYDIINCSFTDFQSLHDLRIEFPELNLLFSNVNFISSNLISPFDIAVNYFKNNITIQ
jgi:hypothetical protein